MAGKSPVSPFEYCGIPFGGIGTGSFELRADGHFHEWQIMNNAPWGNGPATTEMEDEGLFFGLAANDGKKSRVLMLNRTRWGDFNPTLSWESLRWTADPYHMPWMEYPSRIDYQGHAPFANLDYDADDFPVTASLEAWSPLIPLDAKNSALPLGYFTFTLKNNSRKPQRVSLFGALKNCVGYDHSRNESVITANKSGRLSYLLYGRKDLPSDCQSSGSLSFGVWSQKSGPVSHVLHAVHPRDIYDPLMETGRLENLDRSDFSGLVGNNLGGPAVRKDAIIGCTRGVLAKTVQLAPREEVTVTFAISWFFPVMREQLIGTDTPGKVIGHQYENWFSSADDVMQYASRKHADLETRTRAFVDAFYDSSLDEWLLHLINAQLTSFPKATWWDRQGRFAVWEGLGCCGLQTPDITLYGSFSIALLFPELQKKQMEMVTVCAGTIGRPPHAFRGTFCPSCIHRNNRIDNCPDFLIVAWRDALWTGDTSYVKRIWPAVEAFLADMDKTDTDADGLPNNNGVDQSYDQFPLYGTSAYVGLITVGALRAAAEMAWMIGRDSRAEELARKSEKAFEALEDQLWNGEYYNLSFDLKSGAGNAGCMADQLCGDWFVRQTTGDGLVSLAHARKALKAVHKYCLRDGWLANCDWPRGGAVKVRRETSDQANCPWSGTEFAVAAEMLLLGLEDEATDVLRGIFDRYERFGMRYNHIECGAHYYRAMASWAVYLAATGFALDAVDRRLTLKLPRRRKYFVWNTPSAWGRVSFKTAPDRLLELEPAVGRLTLKSLTLAGASLMSATVRLGRKNVPADLSAAPSGSTLTFKHQVTLKPGDRLVVSK